MRPLPKRHYRTMTRAIAHTIRRLYLTRTYKQHELAAIYRIPQGSVSRIVSGRVWE